jgi:hypothetical protein
MDLQGQCWLSLMNWWKSAVTIILKFNKLNEYW